MTRCIMPSGMQVSNGLLNGRGDYVAVVLIAIYILLVVLIVLALPAMLRQSRLVSRARKDYRRARGTQHLRQIRDSLKILNKRLESHEQEKDRLSRTLRRLEQERTDKLTHALCRYVVETQLTQIDGIGPKLRDRIIRYSFDGTLDSLRRAYRVRGVGQQKQWAIRHWIAQKERELPRLMKGSFPGRTGINDEYKQREQNLRKSLKEVEKELDAMRQLRTVASAEEERLSGVTVTHFRQAYKPDREAAEAVAQHLQGTFAEWEPMPSWFKALISKYGG